MSYLQQLTVASDVQPWRRKANFSVQRSCVLVTQEARTVVYAVALKS